ncbi:MAG: aspartate kinase [Puniceicoccaceae bacterium]
MALIIMKFGGTSVGDTARIRNVASKVARTYRAGHQVVVVVSARSGVTNELIARARALHPNPSDREMDMLLSIGEQETIALTAIALQSLGIPAISRTGSQAGIETDEAHTRARIINITGGDIKQQLEQGKIVIVAGFQGFCGSRETTTLGRGGSDLTAIALAVALKADLCQIYTDVEGVFSADPRHVPNARKLNEISYEEMLELASSGSKVMQSRAVKFAQKFNVIFEVRSSFNDQPGTIVKSEINTMEDVVVSGVAIDKGQVKIAVADIPDRPGSAAKLFTALARAGVVVDMIVQNIGRKGKANLTFTVPSEDAYRATEAIESLRSEFPDFSIETNDSIAKVSVVGVGMKSHSGVAGTLFDALARHGINIQMISTSEIKIAVVIDADQGDEAARVAHTAFGLDGVPVSE